ncbi:hypothetical protein CHUAL_008589 [Chamberlinius hualienensis]
MITTTTFLISIVAVGSYLPTFASALSTNGPNLSWTRTTTNDNHSSIYNKTLASVKTTANSPDKMDDNVNAITTPRLFDNYLDTYTIATNDFSKTTATLESCPVILDMQFDHQDRKVGEASVIRWRLSDQWANEEMEISIEIDAYVGIVFGENTTEYSYSVLMPFDNDINCCLTIIWKNCKDTKCQQTRKETVRETLPAEDPVKRSMDPLVIVIVSATLAVIVTAIIVVILYRWMKSRPTRRRSESFDEQVNIECDYNLSQQQHQLWTDEDYDDPTIVSIKGQTVIPELEIASTNCNNIKPISYTNNHDELNKIPDEFNNMTKY